MKDLKVMMRITVNAEECAGCRQCEMVCSFKHTGMFSPTLARITVYKDDRDGLDYPVLCHQCSDCPPLELCPTGAITKSKEGWTTVNEVDCTGCGACLDACKYNAIKLNEKAMICNLCMGNPECVKRCPTGALSYETSLESTETPETAFERLRELWSLE
jgi:carbon-monoxide dehydrogenase iron sulfur subunit